MIKANELRIGNCVLLGGEHTARVTKIDSEENVITTFNPHNKYIDGSSGDHIYLPSGFASGIPAIEKPESVLNRFTNFEVWERQKEIDFGN